MMGGVVTIMLLGMFVAVLSGQAAAQNVGTSCVPTDDCNVLLHEECDGTVCVCSAGYETIGGGTQCFAKDCGSLTAPINGNTVAYSAGTVYTSVAFYTCVTGYKISGSSSRTCQDDATWSGAAPTCVKKDCGVLTVPPNGSIDNTLTTYQEQVVFTCNTGYTLNGASTLTCTAAGTGTWSSDSPTCDIVDCGILNTPENGGKDASSGTTYLATTTFTCNAGYNLIGTATRTCGADGQWSNTDVVCVIKDCGALTKDADGTLVLSSGTTFGSQAIFACNAGYDLIGTSLLVCQADATWSGTEPTCSIRDCGWLAVPTDGSVTYSSGTTYGSTATFSCDTGHDLTGIADINCLADGSWDENEPTCVVKDCGSLTAPINGYTVAYSAGTVYTSVAFYTCVTGYQISGSSSRTCQDDATWSEAAPTCVKKDCGALTVPPNGAIDNTLTTYQEQVVFTCNTGYTLNGASTLTCTAAGTGTWSSDSPTCDIVDCGWLAVPTDGSVTYSSGTTYGSTATFSCDTGHDLTGIADINCLADGNWDENEPTCVVKDCGSVQAPVDGTISSTTGTSYLNAITFSCSDGYTLTGSSTIVCGATGTWSNVPPTCVIKDCGGLVTPVNGQVTLSSGTTFGSQAAFSCNTGYDLDGTIVLNCVASGSWDGNEPSCPIVDCGTLSDPAHGSQTTPSTTYQSSAVFSCDSGYTLTGSGTSVCQADGSWSNAIPTCVINDCGVLSSPANGSVNRSEGTTYLSTSYFTCNIGYTLNGVASRLCQANSSWSDTSPVCIINDCGILSDPANGGQTTPTTTYQSSAVFSCDPGYTLIGSATSMCQADATWNNPAPICIINDQQYITWSTGSMLPKVIPTNQDQADQKLQIGGMTVRLVKASLNDQNAIVSDP